MSCQLRILTLPAMTPSSLPSPPQTSHAGAPCCHARILFWRQHLQRTLSSLNSLPYPPHAKHAGVMIYAMLPCAGPDLACHDAGTFIFQKLTDNATASELLDFCAPLLANEQAPAAAVDSKVWGGG